MYSLSYSTNTRSELALLSYVSYLNTTDLDFDDL